jgi:hypothetical protein
MQRDEETFEIMVSVRSDNTVTASVAVTVHWSDFLFELEQRYDRPLKPAKRGWRAKGEELSALSP